jgi:hypothetical protein
MSDAQASPQEAQRLLGQFLFGKKLTYGLSGVARLGCHRAIRPLSEK